MTETETTRSSAPARRRTRPTAGKKTARKSSAKHAATSNSRQAKALRAALSEVSRSLNRAGSKIGAISRQGGAAAKKAIGSAGKATRRAVQGTMREWKKLDTPRKVEFVATLLSALAAASGTIARGRKKK